MQDMTDKELISKVFKQLIQLNIKKKKTRLKNGPKTCTDIFLKKTYRCPKGT